jgi:hypothetical protein
VLQQALVHPPVQAAQPDAAQPDAVQPDAAQADAGHAEPQPDRGQGT